MILGSPTPPIFAPQPTADDMAQQAQALLASQPQRLPPPTPVAPPIFAEQSPAAAMGVPEADNDPNSPPSALVMNAIHSLFTLPQRAIEGAAQYRPGTGTVPDAAIAPAVETALTMMGGGLGGAEMKAGETALGAGPIRAYHGSPHSFDAFDASKIGTGEGAQAYGHGLYFADNEGVAQSYRDTLGGDTLVTPKGTVFDPMTLEHMNVRSRAHSNGSNLDATIETAQKIADSDSPVADMAQRDLAKLQALKAEGGVKRNPGSMYEVNINADPDHFLDWDKPVPTDHPLLQSEFARQKAIADRYGYSLKEVSEMTPERRASLEVNDTHVANALGGSKGNAVYSQLVNEFGNQQAATDALRNAGVPGIKYFDGNSRGAGEGSRNYVVFDHNLVNIARKYGIAGALAPAAAPIFAGERKQ